MHAIRYYIIWAVMICANAAYAQEIPLRGKVIDHRGHPVAGANVFVKGTVYGATTGDDGSFMFNVIPIGDTL